MLLTKSSFPGRKQRTPKSPKVLSTLWSCFKTSQNFWKIANLTYIITVLLRNIVNIYFIARIEEARDWVQGLLYHTCSIRYTTIELY